MTKPILNAFSPVELPTIQKYKRYLPTAFDESLSILQKINKTIQALEALGEVTTDVINQWNTVMSWILDEGLEETVNDALTKWLTDGTLEDVINGSLFDGLNTKIDQNNANMRNEFLSIVGGIVSASPADVVSTVAELTSKYPTGRTGIVVVQEDGFWYYYSGGQWVKGLSYSQAFYKMVNTDGTAIRLDNDATWLANQDLFSLNTGIYRLSLNTDPSQTGYNANQRNFPVEYGVATISVQHVVDSRYNYKIWMNAKNKEYTGTIDDAGVFSGWNWVIKTTSYDGIQTKRLTYETGSSLKLSDGYKTGVTTLTSLSQLKVGDYQGTLDPAIITDLPKGIDPAGVYFLQKRQIGEASREEYKITHTQSPLTWTGIRNNVGVVKWTNHGYDTDYYKYEIGKFAAKLQLQPKLPNELEFLLLTDTHSERESAEFKKSVLAKQVFQHINYLTSIYPVDFKIHLGDWIDGRQEPIKSLADLNYTTSLFFSDKNTLNYGLKGNHDGAGVYARDQIDSYLVSNFIPKDVQKKLMVTRTNDTGVVFLGEMFYKDFTQYKIRIIGLNSYDSPYTADGTGHINTNPFSRQAYGMQQVKDYANTLLTTPNDYKVIVFTHDVFDNVYDDQTVINGDTMRQITTAFQQGTSVVSYPTDIVASHPDYAYYNLNQTFDFTGKPTNRILANFLGHYHNDNLAVSGGVKYIKELCGLAKYYTPFDVTDTAFDVIRVNPTTGDIKCFRYGAGTDRVFNTAGLVSGTMTGGDSDE